MSNFDYVEHLEEHPDVTDVENQAEEPSQDWFFTFGGNHIWPLTGLSLFKNYVKLSGTYLGTRLEMHRRFGNSWSQQYTSKDFAGQIEKYELAELRLENVQDEYK